MTDFKLGTGVTDKAENSSRCVGRPQVAMHRNCHILPRCRM